MGRIFLSHMGGRGSIVCKDCKTPLTNRENLESTQYQGSSGPAHLYNRTSNLNYGPVENRHMLTGDHWVRDVFCKGCDKKIGWMYELASPYEQRHKEGKVILEKSFILETR